MSAANASIAPSPSHPAEARAHEPSMEEILASIRRIIADDQTLPGNRREREERRRRSSEEDEAESVSAAPIRDQVAATGAAFDDMADEADVLDEADEPQAAVADIHHLRLSRPAAEQLAPVEETDESDDEPAAYDERTEAVTVAAGPEPVAEDPLLSADAATSVASHFQALAASMILNDSGVLQQYAQEMLRPMLKQWLDDNLPVIVERLVRAEIERVARGGRR